LASASTCPASAAADRPPGREPPPGHPPTPARPPANTCPASHLIARLQLPGFPPGFGFGFPAAWFRPLLIARPPARCLSPGFPAAIRRDPPRAAASRQNRHDH